MALALLAGLVALLCASSSSAAPATPSVRLSYARGAGAEACSEEASLREAVATRLGYDPFDDHAERTLSAVVRRSGPSLVARIELQSAAGSALGQRDLSSTNLDCRELMTAMVIAVSLGIDPLSAAPPQPPSSTPLEVPPLSPAAPPPPPTSPVAAPPAASPEDRAKPPPVRARLRVGAVSSFGVSAYPVSFGPTLAGGLERGIGSIDLEGSFSWAPTSTVGKVGARSALYLASLVPCVHVSIFVGCAVAGLGSLDATGIAPVAFNPSAFYADAGVRVGVEVPLSRRFFLEAHADGLVTLTQAKFELDGQPFWTAPPVSGSLALGLGFLP